MKQSLYDDVGTEVLSLGEQEPFETLIPAVNAPKRSAVEIRRKLEQYLEEKQKRLSENSLW